MPPNNSSHPSADSAFFNLFVGFDVVTNRRARLIPTMNFPALLRLDRQNHNFRRHPKANWNYAGADACSYEQVMAVLKDMARGILLPEPRRHDLSANQRNVNLSTVCVPGQ